MQEKTTQSAHWVKRGFFERNNFYFGKLMTARDFSDEQSYFNEKRWMLNRLGLGWGVLCGLKVRPHGHDRHKVVVETGVALDEYGHEIVVCRKETVDLTTCQEQDSEGTSHYFYYIYVKYEECGVHPSPVPIEDCDGGESECVFNRIREGYRFIVTRKKPDTGSQHGPDCDGECHRFLANPSPLISDCCAERPECEPVPLARVCYNPSTPTTAMDIDIRPPYRKLAFSNEILYELIACLLETRQGGAPDRRQHVPLLASTIRGVTFQDGKNVKLDHHNGFEAKYPYRLTSDGAYIWITDRESDQIWRIDRKTNEPLKDPKLYLDDPGWGIAYDGQDMWITHHAGFQDGETKYGKLTRINVCTLERWTLGRLPKCDTLPKCYKFPESAGATDTVALPPYPGEVALHAGDIYVAHGWRKEGESDYHSPQDTQQHRPKPYPENDEPYSLRLTRIDPVKGCIVEIIEVPESEDSEPRSEIRAMASDGDALWITYQASSKERRGRSAVIRKITRNNDGLSVVGDAQELEGELPQHMAFDGTRLWISHDDGVSAIETNSGEEDNVATKALHTALAYSGGSLMWAAVPGRDEAFIHLIDIFSENAVQRLELLEIDPQARKSIEISDMQFDGTYIYLAYHLEDDRAKKGVIHRLLP